MFASKVAKPQTKATESPTSKLMPQRSALVGHQLGHHPDEQALFVQRTTGNQAALRLLAQRASSTLAGKEPGAHNGKEPDRRT